MDRKDIEKRVRLWEAEGYDVSELKAKWFSKGGGGRSPAWIVLPVVAAVVALLILLSGWSPWSPGQVAIVPPRDPATFTLITAITPSGSGSVSPSSGTYDDGTRVTLTASPASGHVFSHWSGDATGTSPMTTVIMNRNINVTANFALVARYTLSTSINPSGSGSVTPGSGTYDAGTRVTLTASPASGYQFSHWSGDATGTSPTITITIDRNKHAVANFEPPAPQVITYTMGRGDWSVSEVSYRRYLDAGEEFGGTVSLSGTYTTVDWSHTWFFEVYDPQGNRVDRQSYTFSSGAVKSFSYTASHAGTWRIRISHYSSHSRNLVLEILPTGWSRQ